jgi:hypothetical protein
VVWVSERASGLAVAAQLWRAVFGNFSACSVAADCDFWGVANALCCCCFGGVYLYIALRFSCLLGFCVFSASVWLGNFLRLYYHFAPNSGVARATLRSDFSVQFGPKTGFQKFHERFGWDRKISLSLIGGRDFNLQPFPSTIARWGN